MTLLGLVLWAAAEFSGAQIEIVNEPEGRVTILSGGVEIREESTLITGGKARFYTQQNRAVVTDSVRIRAPGYEIRTDTAHYDLTRRAATLSGAVTVSEPGRAIFCQRLLYDYATDLIEVPGPLTIVDSARALSARGAAGRYALGTDEGELFPAPRLRLARAETTDVASRRMRLDNRRSRFWADESVRLRSGRAFLDAESLGFDFRADTGQAWLDAAVGDDRGGCRGDTVRFTLADDELRTVTVLGPRAGTWRTRDGDRIEFTGARLDLLFAGGSLARLDLAAPGPLRLWRRPPKP